MHRAKVAKQKMKSEPKVVVAEPKIHNEVEEFDSVLFKMPNWYLERIMLHYNECK